MGNGGEIKVWGNGGEIKVWGNGGEIKVWGNGGEIKVWGTVESPVNSNGVRHVRCGCSYAMIMHEDNCCV